MDKAESIDQADIWYVDFEPVRGSEIGKVRPALILSSTEYNTASATIFIAPVTSGKPKNEELSPFHILISASRKNGLSKDSYINITQIKVASRFRFERKIGTVENKDIIRKIASKILKLWDIEPEELVMKG